MKDNKKSAGPALLTPLYKTRNADPPNLAAGYTSSRGIVPLLIKGNLLTCTDMICAQRTFLRIKKGRNELPASAYAGRYRLGKSGVLTITAPDDNTISWSSNVDITCIFLKGGPGGNSYSYDLPARSDAGLSSPLDEENGRPRGISHINICYSPPS